MVAQLLVLWYETEFIVEYVQLFKLHKIIPMFKEFVNQREQGSPLNFCEFLMTKKKFHTKLISCHICLCTMLCLIITVACSLFIHWWIIMLWLPFAYVSDRLYKLAKES